MHLGLADLFRAAIFAAAHVFAGSLGAGIVAVSLGVRLALLPLTIRLARRALAQQAILARLQPELQRLQARYGNDPAARWRRTQALYRRGGRRPVAPPGRPPRRGPHPRAAGGGRVPGPGGGGRAFFSFFVVNLCCRPRLPAYWW